MDAIEELTVAIRARAHSLGLAIHESPRELSLLQMPAQFLSESPQKSAVDEPGTPSPIRSLFVGPQSVIIGSLGEEGQFLPATEELPKSVFERWRGYQRIASIARASLDKNRNDDLVLVLVGPVGSHEKGEWNALSSQIERNDLVCRKLVWLPPKAISCWQSSLQDFLKRTFLARPWLRTETTEQQRLDKASDLGDTLTKWQSILDGQSMDESAIDYDDLVDQLIKNFRQ